MTFFELESKVRSIKEISCLEKLKREMNGLKLHIVEIIEDRSD